MDVVALTCGGARWPLPPAATAVMPVPARPGRSDLAPVLESLAGRRLVVCGTDADLAAVAQRLLRDELLGTVEVGYVPTSAASAVARLWALPVVPADAAAVALGSPAGPVPLLRDDAGGVLVGRGVVHAVDGVVYCDDDLVLRGRAARIEVSPDLERGLVVRVVARRASGLLGRRVRVAAGRAVQLGLAPTDVLRDGVADRTRDRWTWYRHTEDLRLARGPVSSPAGDCR